MTDFMEIADQLSANKELAPLMDVLEQVMSMDDNNLNDDNIDAICGAITGAYTPKIRETATKSIIDQFEAEHMSKKMAMLSANTFKNEMADLIDNVLQPTAHKKKLLDAVFAPLFEIYDAAIERYHGFDIELPIMLDEGARMPTYAHETDACADVYALEDVVVGAHTLSNKIRTGLHFALPEGWEIGLLPRSSIGSNTGLRLSNSRGVIDQTFRNEMMILYDNISDSDYTIKAGDRIAQIFVQPTYRFKGIQVNKADFDAIEGDRGGGLGSTGV